jgi:protein-glutamine gamma-glutamyltransferase
VPLFTSPSAPNAAAQSPPFAGTDQGADRTAGEPIDPVRARLNVLFAIATCLSGLTLAGNPATELLPVVACFFAIVGLVFVDLLRWFSLSPSLAYVALGGIALYSVSRLLEIGTGIADELQMVVVAELLVLVQAVLMLQRKNRRIYEQLAIFCLLELIVAAIFNDAINYGLLLLPLGMVGAAALAMLQGYGTTVDAFANEFAARRSDGPDWVNAGDNGPGDNDSGDGFNDAGSALIRTRSPRSATTFRHAAILLPRITSLVFAPAVLMIAILFFYGLPRTAETARSGGGRVLVGFSPTVRLGQIGRMMQSDATALKIDLVDRKTGNPYSIMESLYLRGAVLETYNPGVANDGSWSTRDIGSSVVPTALPAMVMGRGDWPGEDIRVRISVEPNSSQALFAIPPYHQLATIPEVIHQSDRWLLARRDRYGLVKSNRIAYQFGSNAFRNSRQTRFVPRWDDTSSVSGIYEPPFGPVDGLSHGAPMNVSPVNRYDAKEYVQRCLDYDRSRVPTAAEMGDRLAKSIGPNPLAVAMRVEQHLSSGTAFEYSLDSINEPVLGVDPIEQFLSIDRRGNCQYFASAMVLILRSQGIPARLVVGYSTDEYNSIGKYYVARQLHAHAWVEALIDEKWVPEAEVFTFDDSAAIDPATIAPATIDPATIRLADGDNANEDVDESRPESKDVAIDASGQAADDDDADERRPSQYWVRFDPTPGGGGVERPVGGRVSDVFEFAQNLWSDFVVERTQAPRGRSDGGAVSGTEAVASEYESMFRAIASALAQFRSGRSDDGTFSFPQSFSWVAAFFGAAATLFVAVVVRLRLPAGWFRWRRGQASTNEAAMPGVAFFAETVELLRRAGIERSCSQTPLELTRRAATILAEPGMPPVDQPLRLLTQAFYYTRFGATASNAQPTRMVDDESVSEALQSVRQRVEQIEARPSSRPPTRTPKP